MARIDPDQPLLQSVLDRLLDANPERTHDDPRQRGQYVQELRRAVRRDLEALLNTRQRCISPPADLTELETSLLTYGIPDFSGLDLSSEEHRETFRATIEEVIKRFEPRFQRVSVILLDNVEPLDRTLRLRIDALMYAQPAPEAIVLDSYLDPVTHSFAMTTKPNV
ncbi:MAG: type VI secretion system baseplate subunit TssE [Alphaproteobacteria bacterium]|nr:type VI secretion system baseplate subunit TssE [Alphaproteobacteria bacterium]